MIPGSLAGHRLFTLATCVSMLMKWGWDTAG